jgi:hypothetical protein
MICDSSNMGGVSPRFGWVGVAVPDPAVVCGLGFDFVGEDFWAQVFGFRVSSGDMVSTPSPFDGRPCGPAQGEG